MDEGEALFRQLIELAPDAVWINERGRLVFANPATAHMLGYESSAEVLALDPGNFVHPEDRQAMADRSRQMIMTGKSLPPYEYRVRHHDGRWLITEVHSMPIKWQERPAILGFARDITARKEMEARLVRADRLAALGTLLAGIAHEMNNPLSYITLAIEEMADTLEAQPPVPQLNGLLGEVRRGVQRVASIVRQLRATSRPESEDRGPVQLVAVIDSALRVAQNQIRHRARLIVDSDDVPPVEGNAQRLEQVFLNLLVNATQALPDGRAENEIRVGVHRLGDDQVVVEVRDNGPGIAPEVLPRIFDPFFTTKSVGVGMGLGLSICHGIVTAHGGSITVDSDPAGGGVCFRVTLPVMKPVAAEARPAPPVAAAGAGPASPRLRVLVVDDEPALGEMIGRMLRHDYQVEVVADAREALKRLLGGLPHDLVLCDLMMPSMTGMDLFDEVIRHRPELGQRFVFMTGGAFTDRASEFLAHVPNDRIDKPFNRAALKALLAGR
jgi:two-component system cell cycle sensor histidine kinase/response regulator CckA